eukprot:m.22895 g.22895  ORF g.22895 m.22895 type:complete len:221 (-) comp5492_c0_seq1:282-944(-)
MDYMPSYKEEIRSKNRTVCCPICHFYRTLQKSKTTSAMVFVLVIGDFHIPHRANAIPKQFKEKLVPGKIQHVLCTGNLTSRSTFEYLKTIASDVHIVSGDFDDETSYPAEKTVNIGGFKIGFCHGHTIVPWGDKEALEMTRRRMDADVLISGHTHEFESFEENGKLFLNPGSATGAYSATCAEVVPSFVLLDIQDDKINIFVYKLHGEEFGFQKLEFTKK